MQSALISTPFVFPVISYLAGSIPFGLIFARFHGKDPRRYGSGNIGATNIARLLGKKWGLLTLFSDILKGFLPVIWAYYSGIETLYLALTGLAAVLGHCFSIFLFFRGGKGVATAVGVFLAICPKSVGIAAIVFFAVLRMFGYVSASSLAAATAIPVLVHIFCRSEILESMSWSICLIIWLKHVDNLKRLSKGEEKRINFQSQGT